MIIEHKKDAIFFHMGPGANAQAEALLLAKGLPHIHFWDQPQQKNSAGAFKNLVDAAEKEVRQLVDRNNGKPIAAIAHSFGGHVFHQVASRDPSLFSFCTFHGTGYDIPGGFFKLLKTMEQDSATPADLRMKMRVFLTAHSGGASASGIWDYIGLIAQDPSFYRHYWPSQDLYTAFVSVAQKTSPLDMESFQNILNDFLESHFHPEKLVANAWQGPIEIHLGDKDPLIDVNRESKLWKTIFPQAHIKVLKNAGHFIHLENHLKA